MNTVQKVVRGRAQASLLDSLGAVQAAIAMMPSVMPAPRNMSDIFMMADPVLSSLNRSILDGRANLAQIVAMCGPGDPMAEALSYQISAIEKAYAERLAALRRKRDESKRAMDRAMDKKILNSAEDQKLHVVRTQPQPERRRDNAALWLWVLLIARGRKTSANLFGHVPNAA